MPFPAFIRALRAYLQADKRDADAMATYARMRLSAHGRRMILSGLAGFNRNVTGG
jgi:hypothetical protein